MKTYCEKELDNEHSIIKKEYLRFINEESLRLFNLGVTTKSDIMALIEKRWAEEVRIQKLFEFRTKILDKHTNCRPDWDKQKLELVKKRKKELDYLNLRN